jgi:dolichyl-phosphate-mannose-protein mannosyltransferase
MQTRMYKGQLRVITAHPYMSQWWEWPLLTRRSGMPLTKEADGALVRGVLLLGNPLIMWSGLLTLLACAWGWYKERTRTPFFILTFYLAYYLCWILIPPKDRLLLLLLPSRNDADVCTCLRL